MILLRKILDEAFRLLPDNEEILGKGRTPPNMLLWHWEISLCCMPVVSRVMEPLI